MEYHSSIFGIKGRCEACAITTLPSNKGTKIDIQKGIQKNCELRGAQRGEWIQMGSAFFWPTEIKTNHIRFLGEFCNLNRKLKRKPYPIHKIREMLLNLEGFKYYTSLDLNMGYYHIRHSEHASNLCTIILSRVKYRYKRLPMGVSNSPDIFQEKMN